MTTKVNLSIEDVDNSVYGYARSLIEASLDPLVTISPEGKITDVNKASEWITGVNRDDLIGSDFCDYFTDSMQAHESYQQVFLQGFVLNYPLAIRHASGKVSDVLYNASVYRDNNGDVVGVVATARDVTERNKVAEELEMERNKVEIERNKVAAEANKFAAKLEVERNKIEIERNKIAAELEMERNKIEVERNKVATELEAERNKVAAELETERNRVAAELESERNRMEVERNKAAAELETKRNNLEVKRNKIAAELEMERNKVEIERNKVDTKLEEERHKIEIERNKITADLEAERHKIAAELERNRNYLENLVAELSVAKEVAETANIAKSIFIATMSHELRTPLNAILGFSELMSLDAAATTEQKETLGIINRSGAHLLSMINDVLDISKIEAGRLELDIHAFDLLQLLNDIGDMIGVRATNKQLKFDLDIATDVPRFVKADDGKLRQILINLLGNAIKFTKQGTVVLRAQAQPLQVAMTMLIIEVTDSGTGIPEDKQDELFKPFVQLMQENSDTAGTGLGLTISKSLIELMGGHISVSSALGEGSTFKIELPITIANDVDIVIKENYRAVKGLAPNQPNFKLLVVDDNADNRLLLVSMLSSVGFQVREAENGQEAINAFEQWQPDLIWMDMRMPVMDGYEATAKIRQLSGGHKVKILALTASAFVEQYLSIIEAGCDAVLHKPFHIPEIFAALTKYLGVKFIYDDTPSTVSSPTLKITAEMLMVLPLELREQLHQAALQLDTEDICTVIAQIRAIVPDIADSLEALAKGYQFEQIIQLTDVADEP